VKLDGAGVLAPTPQNKPPLTYPPMALRQKVEGTVELWALVDEAGAVADVRTATGLGVREDLTATAVQHVKRWTFRPATKSGVPVKVWLPVKVEFRLPK
jgi:protein TonB